MTDAHFEFNPQSHFTMPDMKNTSQSRRRKIIGQCPTCQKSFTSRSELRDHMADSHHPSADESDAVSFGEMSDYDSLDGEQPSHPKPSTHEPTLDQDGFEFSSANQADFDAFEADPNIFAHPNAEQGSVHTIYDEDEQPSSEQTQFEHKTHHARTPQKEALGVLYCATCDKYFGNEKVFKRHFMFGVKHGEESRDMRDLYYRVWARTWAEEAEERRGRGAEVFDGMEI